MKVENSKNKAKSVKPLQ